eukprot:IDg20513t1
MPPHIAVKKLCFFRNAYNSPRVPVFSLQKSPRCNHHAIDLIHSCLYGRGASGAVFGATDEMAWD